MMPVDIHLGLFTPVMGREMSERAAVLFQRAFATVNLDYLRNHPEQKGPYDSGIQYIRENDTQHWLGIPQLMELRQVKQHGHKVYARGGDCKDLTPFTVAWYYRRGELVRQQAKVALAAGQVARAAKLTKLGRYMQSAKVDLMRVPGGGFFSYHVRVRWPEGRIEDPSAILGMNKNGLVEL